jgi:hypothetical protein
MAGWTAARPCSAMRLSERRMPALIDELEWTVHTGSVCRCGRSLELCADRGVRFAVRRRLPLAGAVGHPVLAQPVRGAAHQRSLDSQQGCRGDVFFTSSTCSLVCRMAGDTLLKSPSLLLLSLACPHLDMYAMLHRALASASMCSSLSRMTLCILSQPSAPFPLHRNSNDICSGTLPIQLVDCR